MKLNRRHALSLSLAAGLAGPGRLSQAQEADTQDSGPRTALGLCQYCGNFARKQARSKVPQFDLYRAENFFRHARELGAGGYQVSLGVMDPARAAALREQAEAAGMYIEGIVKPPLKPSDLDRFDAEMRTAAAVGAKAVRSTIFTGRRYEFFKSMQQYREHDRQATRSLELAAPIAEKHRVAFAPENHKDHRIAERVAALKKIDSEFVGACVDTGNNFALLEDPVDTAEALAPWAHAVHLKDQAVQLTDEGFLFGDIPLGQGFIDLLRIVATLKRARPDVHFTLELLTRDPLSVPCLEPKYWTTFAEVPATDLARTLRTVRDHQASELQYPSRLKPPQQVALEESNVRQSLRYAREVLGI